MKPEELQGAVERVLAAAGYIVEPNKFIHGAQFDIVAQRRGAAIDEVFYVEVTTEYVDVGKYGKDLTKLVLAREKDPGGHSIIISSEGFAGLTKERATVSRIHCWTYEEFRKRFVPTSAYEALVLGPPSNSAERKAPDALIGLSKPLWRELDELQSVYQEPEILTRPRNGSKELRVGALEWFDTWLTSSARSWVSLVGDYGTGKTALSKVLLRRWMHRWRIDGELLPVRIELRDFATKFDFEGLLIHFWKAHNLDEMPIRTLEMLVAEGRVVFLLDGYDEMAQNLNLMDRRNCLVALAKTLSGSSTGIITSRPNYFTEAEELNVVELLYRKGTNFHRLDRDLVLKESELDSFLSQYYYERNDARLLDLSPAQVDALISLRLDREPEMLANVRRILDSIYQFSTEEYGRDSAEAALANKPVVVTYLLEVAENLGDLQLTEYQPLDEWGIYQLIMDRLVLRDQKRTSGIVVPSERRLFLQRLALKVTVNRRSNLSKAEMLSEVHALFGKQINRHGDLQAPAQEEIYFADLRSSASLTSEINSDEWMFSHNSLREFLVAELVVESLRGAPHLPPEERSRVVHSLSNIPLTQGLLRFVGKSFNHFEDLWGFVSEHASLSHEKILPFIIPVLAARYPKQSVTKLMSLVPQKRISNIVLTELQLKQEEFVGWTFEDVLFDRSRLEHVAFVGCTFRGCGFYDCSLREVRFEKCAFEIVELSSIVFQNCRFSGSEFTNERLTNLRFDGKLLSDDTARAFLRYRNAIVAPGRHLNTYQFYPQWEDFAKVITQLTEDLALTQELGLVKKGGVADTKWAQGLVNILVNSDYLERSRRSSRDFVRVRPGRMDELKTMLDGNLPQTVVKHFGRR